LTNHLIKDESMKPARYHPALVTLHWLLAVVLLVALGMGTLSLQHMPNASPEKVDALRGHMIAGIAILILTVLRLVIRRATAHPAPATTGNPLLDRIGRGTHHALYLLVFLMALSGIATAVQAGLPGIVFGGSGAPLPANFDAFAPRAVHGVVAALLLALIALHVLAALYHQFVRRDGLIARMGFGRR
jgi:cytochrome b561